MNESNGSNNKSGEPVSTTETGEYDWKGHQDKLNQETWERMLGAINPIEWAHGPEENESRLVSLFIIHSDDYAGVGYGIRVPDLTDEEFKNWDFKHPWHSWFSQLISEGLIWAIPRNIGGIEPNDGIDMTAITELVYPLSESGCMFTAWVKSNKGNHKFHKSGNFKGSNTGD